VNPTDPQFLAWAKRFGYTPWRMTEPHQRAKFGRYWLAWQAGIAPDCKRAYAVAQCAGFL